MNRRKGKSPSRSFSFDPFELLLDAEGVGGCPRPEFTKGVAISFAPGGDRLTVGAALLDEADDPIGKLPDGHGFERGVVEPVDDNPVFAANPIEPFERRAFSRRLGRREFESGLGDFFRDDGVGEVLRPAFAQGLGLGAFGEHQEGHVGPFAGAVERLAVGRGVVDPDGFERREFLPAGVAGDRVPLAVEELPDTNGAADEAGRVDVGLHGVVSDENRLVLVGAVIAGSRGDGAEPLDRGHEREAALLRVVLVEDKGMDLPAQRVEAQAPGPVDEHGEFVFRRIGGDGPADEGEVAGIVEGRQADDRRVGAGEIGGHGQTRRMRVTPPLGATTPGMTG